MGWSSLGGEDIEFSSCGASLPAHVGRPAAPGRCPAVILIHGMFGPGPGTRRAAERLGDEGYVGMLVNWQTREKDPPDSELMQYVADAADFLRRQDYVDGERIAVAGFCRGGGLVYLALEHYPWLRAGVSMHGFPFYSEKTERRPEHPYDLADRIQAPVLILHGAADPHSPVGGIYRMAQRLDELGKIYQLQVYSGTGHAFTLPDGNDYNPIAAADAWCSMVAFLHQYLRA